jgi:hypothetical protein
MQITNYIDYTQTLCNLVLTDCKGINNFDNYLHSKDYYNFINTEYLKNKDNENYLLTLLTCTFSYKLLTSRLPSNIENTLAFWNLYEDVLYLISKEVDKLI